MSDAAWIGYTPMAKGATNSMKALWQKFELPEEPDFTHWSAEYARDIYQLVVGFAEVGREELLRALHDEGVWTEDPCDHQWTPLGWVG